MLSFQEQSRIQHRVVLGLPPPADESAEARDFRERIERDVAQMRAEGITLIECPFDLDGTED